MAYIGFVKRPLDENYVRGNVFFYSCRQEKLELGDRGTSNNDGLSNLKVSQWYHQRSRTKWFLKKALQHRLELEMRSCFQSKLKSRSPSREFPQFVFRATMFLQHKMTENKLKFLDSNHTDMKKASSLMREISFQCEWNYVICLWFIFD